MGLLDRFRLRRVSGIQAGAPTDMTAQASYLQAGTQVRGVVPQRVLDALQAEGMDTTAMFAPGGPLQPYAPWGQPPRQRDFVTGYNIGALPRSREMGRVSFDTLRAVATNYDLAEMCIVHLIKDVSSLDWEIVPIDGEEKDVETAIKTARDFFRSPDRKTPFKVWQKRYVRDILTFDAGCLYKQRTRAGKLYRVRVISGTTVSPTIDYYGETPDPPAPAYVQFINGVPWEWMQANDVIYQPMNPDPESPYGRPPLESLILSANTDMRLQQFFLEFFTEGSTPDTWMVLGTDNPLVVNRQQESYDAEMAGDQAKKRRVRFLPKDSMPFPVKQATFQTEFALFLMRKTCAAFGVTPNDLGFTDAVNKASADTQVDVQYRVGVLPLIDHLKSIYDSILQDDLGLPVQFQFDTGAEEEDRFDEARSMDLYIRAGVVSPDEVRSKVFGLPTDNTRPVPRIFVDRTGAVPLVQIYATSGDVDPQTIIPTEQAVEDAASPTDATPDTIPQNPDGEPTGVAPTEPSPPPPPHPSQTVHPASVEVARELRRWRENSRNRVREGKAPRLFASDLIPAPTRDAVWSRLERATSLADVEAVFAEVGIGRRPFARATQRDLYDTFTERRAALEKAHATALRPHLVAAARDALSAAAKALGIVKRAEGDTPAGPSRQDIVDAIDAALGDLGLDASSDLGQAVRDAYTAGAAEGQAQGTAYVQHVRGLPMPDLDSIVHAELPALATKEYPVDTWIGKILDGLGYSLGGSLKDALDGGADYSDLLGITETAVGDEGSTAYLVLNDMLTSSINAQTFDAYRANDVAQVDLLTSPNAEENCTDIEAQNPWQRDDAPDLPVHPNCFPAGTLVSGPRVVGSTERWYEGDVIDLRTAGGTYLTATPNHPILTPKGWVSAGSLLQGDDVVRCLDAERIARLGDPDDYHGPASIEEVAVSLRGAVTVTAARVPVSAEDFHGDAADNQVCVVRADGLLRDHGTSALHQPRGEGPLVVRGDDAGGLSRRSSSFQFRESSRCSADGVVGGLGEKGPVLGRGASHSSDHAAPAVARGDSTLNKPTSDDTTANVEAVGYRLLAFPVKISADDGVDVRGELCEPCRCPLGIDEALAFLANTEKSTISENADQPCRAHMMVVPSDLGAISQEVVLDRIIEASRRRFAGYVYNLETTKGWYVAEGIITHNCRCAWAPHV